MSSCMWPLLPFVADEEEIEEITKEVMADISNDIDFEVKRAIDEVVKKIGL